MTVTITITDPTATEATALRAYLTALHWGTATAPLATGDRGPELYVPTGAGRILPPQSELGEPKKAFSETFSAVTALEPDHTTAEDAGAPDFDSAGMPWNEKIHASSRATVADGTWRKKRGVSPEEVAEVEAQIAPKPKGDYDGVDLSDPTPLPMEGDWDGQPEVPNVPVGGQTAPEVPEAPAEDAPPPPPAPTANPFLALMSSIGKSKLDKAKKDELLTAAGALDEKGAPSILELNKRPELIDGFIALLDSEGV